MATIQRHPVQAVPGFQFLACVNRAPYCETWTARDPNGELWRIQFVHGFSSLTKQEVVDSVRRLLAPHHPALIKVDVLAQDESRIVFGSEAIHNSVRQHFDVCRQQGQPGLPRKELLGYLRIAAETCDTLYDRHRLQHLGLHPQGLLLDPADRLRLADFGLAQLLWHRAGQDVARLNRRYAAPELFDRNDSPSCDQYSLALIFAEMFTGRHPFARYLQRPNPKTIPSPQPDLEEFTTADRAILARALDRNPKKRFGRCAELVEALTHASTEERSTRPEPKVVLPASPRPDTPGGQALMAVSAVTSARMVEELLRRAAPQGGTGNAAKPPFGLESGRQLWHQCLARWPHGLATLKLRQFGEEWNALLVEENEHRLVFHVPTAVTFWQRWRGQQPGLRVEVLLRAGLEPSDSFREVTVRITPLHLEGAQAVQLLDSCGPTLLESVRSFLYLTPERRTRDRVQFDQTLSILPVQDRLRLGTAIVGHTKDVSPTGIGLLLPRIPDTPHICIQTQPAPDLGSLALLGKIVRVRTREDGIWEAGARFLTAESNGITA